MVAIIESFTEYTSQISKWCTC